MYYTYAHIRPDTEVIFYVGKGSKKRAYARTDRNADWKKVVRENRGNFEVRILNWFNSSKDALDAEIWQIAQLSEFGHLVNKTRGGDGIPEWTLELKNKLKESLRKPECLEKKAAYWTEERRSLQAGRVEVWFSDSDNRDYHAECVKAALTDEGVRDKMRANMVRRFENPEERAKVSARVAGDKNPSKRPEVKLKVSQTRALKGSEFYKMSEESRRCIGIKNSAHMRSKGDAIHTKREDVRLKNSESRTARWKDPISRAKYMFLWWWVSNVKPWPYWGA